ncbi:MAG: hypothetical protein JWR27_3020 [Aeromicrobium sp.]|nr:hypothetical protein [Aeromicrobium sp.]
MTEHIPPPPSPEAPTAEQPPAGRNVKGAVVGGVAVAAVLAGGLGAFAAYQKLDGGGPQPHDVMPASTQAYARIDLDPSASQKIELFKLIRRFPDVADDIGIQSADQDVRELIFDEVLSPDCPDIDYADDVEPWLGSRIGIGGNIEDETFQIALQTTDEKASRAGIKKLFACSDEEYGIAYLDGYAILSDSQQAVDAAITATKKGTLADKKEFVDDFDALGDQGIASAWVDIKALAKVPELADTLGEQADTFAKAGSGATTLRVDGNALELVALSGRTSDEKPSRTGLGTLPRDTIAALSVSGAGDQVGESFNSFVQELDGGLGSLVPGVDDLTGAGIDPYDDSSGDGAQDFIDEIERDTGLRLPEDLETLFGDNLTLAVGSRNVEQLPTFGGPDDLSTLDVALSLTSDPTKALDLVQRLADLAADVGTPLVAAPTDRGAVLATNQDAADAVSDPDGTLGDRDTFSEVVPDAEDSSGGLFVDIGAIIDALQKADPPEDVAKGLEEASELSAFGLSVANDDDHSIVRLRLALTEKD